MTERLFYILSETYFFFSQANWKQIENNKSFHNVLYVIETITFLDIAINQVFSGYSILFLAQKRIKKNCMIQPQITNLLAYNVDTYKQIIRQLYREYMIKGYTVR